MAKKTPDELPAISEQLREAVDQAIADGFTRYAIAKMAGMKPNGFVRWYDGGEGIRLASADELAKLFGMRLTKPKRLKKPSD